MFLFCCPKRKPKEALKQSLIQQDKSIAATQIIKAQTKLEDKQKERNKNMIQQTPKLQKVMSEEIKSDFSLSGNKDQIKRQQRLNKSDSKSNQPNMGVMPNFNRIENIRRPLTRQYDKNLISHKKSHLWNEQLKSDLIYLNLKNSSEIYMSYRLTKNQQLKGCPNVLDYFLSKSQDKIFVLIGKQAMINAKLATINKYNHNLIVANYGRSAAIQQNLTGTELIIMEDLRSIRWTGIDGMIIMTDNLHTYEEVKSYFNTIVKDLSWDELKKAAFFFPVFMTLENISQLLFSCMRQYAINSSLQKVSIDLAFDMCLIEGTNLDSYIIIKSRTQEHKLINSVYDHLKISIVLFGKYFCNETQKIYRDFYIRIRQKTLKDYFGMIQLYKRNPQQFRTKVRQFRDIDPLIFTDLENSSSLKQFLCEDSGFYYVISNKVREQMGRVFNIAELQRKQVDTPVKYEWDDDATADDFKTVLTKSKLDGVAQSQLDQIDLDMGLMDDDDDDLYVRPKPQEDPEIQIRVQQTNEELKQRMLKIDQDEESSTSFNKGPSKATPQFHRNRCDRNHRYDHFE